MPKITFSNLVDTKLFKIYINFGHFDKHFFDFKCSYRVNGRLYEKAKSCFIKPIDRLSYI